MLHRNIFTIQSDRLLAVKFLQITLILLCALCGHATRADETAVRPFVIHHFPRAAYLKERTTFVLSGPQNSEVAVRLGEKQIAGATFGEKELELNLTLNETGNLSFSCGTVTRVFLIVSPDTKDELEVRDGFLGTKAAPAILLVAHRHPPKHDRTWETVKVLGTLFGSDYRPSASSAVALGLDYLKPETRTRLNAAFWKQAVLPRQTKLSSVAGLILAIGDVKPADVLVIAPGISDLELGTTPLQYRMHLEWLIQRVNRKQFPHVFLVLPPMTAGQRKCFPETRANMKLAASGNNAIFIERDSRQGEAEAGWGTEIHMRMKKYLAIK